MPAMWKAPVTLKWLQGLSLERIDDTGELIFGNMFNDVYPMSGTAITTCISSGQLASDHAVSTMTK